MIKKIVLILTVLFLVVLPFLVGNTISNYSPYTESNSFWTYVIVLMIISIAFVSVVIAVVKYYNPSFGSWLVAGLFLLLLFCPITGIVGLAAAPDLSLKLLDHPEREHLRYILLFVSAIFFLLFFIFWWKSNSTKLKHVTRWVVFLFFILAFSEFIWEFTHHYLYPEAMKEWINNGKKAEEFGKNYDTIFVITIGVLGRLIQFTLLIWLSIHLYKLGHIKIWSPILIIIFSLIGIVSAVVIFVTEMNIPKGFEILFLFFIPGIPFLLLYWLGIGIVTQVRKS